MANNETAASRLSWLRRSWKWALAASGLPGLYATWLQDFAARHMLLAGGLLMTYWTVLACTDFVWQAIRDPIDQVRQRVSAYAAITAGNLLFRHERRYRSHLLGELERIGSTGAYDLESSRPFFDDVYVRIELAASSPHAVASDALADGDSPRTEFRVVELLNTDAPQFLVVLGAAGFGKSTLSQHLTRELARGRIAAKRRTVPILIPLAQWAAHITTDPPVELAEIATSGMQDQQGVSEWLDSKLRAGRCIILADGLDEISTPQTRAAVIRWLIARRNGHRERNSCVLTSRPDSYRSTPVTEVPVDVAYIRRLSPHRADRFIDSRFNAMSLPDRTVRAEKFKQQIRTPALAALRVNPLLLTLMITLYRSMLEDRTEPSLPVDRVEVYRRVCALLAERRATSEVTVTAKLDLLGRLAYVLMETQTTQIEIEEAERRRCPRELIEALKIDGLLVISRENQISFAHKTFQEYAAAVHLHREGPAQVLLEHVADEGDWWRETILFFSGLGPFEGRPAGERIIEACLRQPESAPALALALAIREQSSPLPPELERRLLRLVDAAAAAGAEPEYRANVARAVLSHHLNRAMPKPITARIHRLFVADRDGDPAPDARYPDYPDQPVVGVRAADAIDLVRWVNQVLDTSAYRLPTREEADHSDLQHMQGVRHTDVVTAWISAGGELPHRWRRTGSAVEVLPVSRATKSQVVSRFIRKGEVNNAPPSTGRRNKRYSGLSALAGLDPEGAQAVESAVFEAASTLDGVAAEYRWGFSPYEVLSVAAAARPQLADSRDTQYLGRLASALRSMILVDGREPLSHEIVRKIAAFRDAASGPNPFNLRSRNFPNFSDQSIFSFNDDKRLLRLAVGIIQSDQYTSRTLPLESRENVLVSMMLLARNEFHTAPWTSSIDRFRSTDGLREHQRALGLHEQSRQDSLWSSREAPSLPSSQAWSWPLRQGQRTTLDDRLNSEVPKLMSRVFGRYPSPTTELAAQLRDIALRQALRSGYRQGQFVAWLELAAAATEIELRFSGTLGPDEMVILTADE